MKARGGPALPAPAVTAVLRRPFAAEETINADLGEIRFDQVARAMGTHGKGERVSRRR